MNLFPEPRPGGRSGGEAGAARGCSAPAPSRRTAGFAGVWVWMPVPALSGTSGVSQPVPAPRFADTFSPTSFYRRPFIGGLLPKAFFGGPSFGYGAAFLCPAEQPGPAPSRLCLLSAPTPLRSDPSPLCPVPVPSRPVPSPSRPVPSRPRPCSCPVPVPSLSRPCPCSCPVPVPSLPRPCPVPAPSLSRPCPVPVPVPVPFLSLFLSRSCPVPVPVPSLSLSLSLSRSCPLSALSPLRSVPFPSRSCPRPLFWRGAASSLFFRSEG